MEKGVFGVIDGGEGAGKGVVTEFLKERLESRVIFTREPGGTPVSERIRELLMNKENKSMLALTELFLFCGARAQHVGELVAPALERGGNVISDRFDFATLAYQIYGREAHELIDSFRVLNDIAKGGVSPDFFIYLDVEPEVGLERIAGRVGEVTRFDEEKIDFHKRVREGYLKQAVEMGPYGVTDCNVIETTNLNEEEVKLLVWDIVRNYLKL